MEVKTEGFTLQNLMVLMVSTNGFQLIFKSGEEGVALGINLAKHHPMAAIKITPPAMG